VNQPKEVGRGEPLRSEIPVHDTPAIQTRPNGRPRRKIANGSGGVIAWVLQQPEGVTINEISLDPIQG
jgi:hypothetical protein